MLTKHETSPSPSLSEVRTCEITSVISTSPSSLHVKWNHYVGATNYFLDLRVINSTDIAPVVLTLAGLVTETEVYGLRPGAHYSVTLKVFQYYFVVCHVTQEASTGEHPPKHNKNSNLVVLLGVFQRVG